MSEEIKTKTSSQDEIERKIWDVVKQVPGLNVGYGSVRLVIYISKGNREESWESAVGVAKGLVETAAITGSVFVAPIVTPIAAGALTGIVTGSIKGVAHLIVFVIEHPDEFVKNKNVDRKEQLIYNEVKEIPAIGAAYSAARTPIYLVKGNKEEAKLSGLNSIFGSANTAVNCGVGMLTSLDEETQKVIQKIAKSIIQVVSKKVLEKVANKQLTLEEGLCVVESVEAKCEILMAENSNIVEIVAEDKNENNINEETQNYPEISVTSMTQFSDEDLTSMNINESDVQSSNENNDTTKMINDDCKLQPVKQSLLGSAMDKFLTIMRCKRRSEDDLRNEATDEKLNLGAMTAYFSPEKKHVSINETVSGNHPLNTNGDILIVI